MLSISLASLVTTFVAILLMLKFLDVKSLRVFVHFNLLIALFFRSAALLLGYLLLARSKTLAQLLVLEEWSLNAFIYF